MTLIVGIRCSDGVVMASDSAATYASMGMHTIGQQQVTKLSLLGNPAQGIYASTGAIGMPQILHSTIDTGLRSGALTAFTHPPRMLEELGNQIAMKVQPQLQLAAQTVSLVGQAGSTEHVLCASLIALAVGDEPCLFQFNHVGGGEIASPELPFVALGSGQQIADPFLAFLKRILWHKRAPSVAEGRLAASWVVDHVRETNPGGVGGPTQLGTLRQEKGWRAEIHDADEVNEHAAQIRDAEDALRDHVLAQGNVADAPEIPTANGRGSSGS